MRKDKMKKNEDQKSPFNVIEKAKTEKNNILPCLFCILSTLQHTIALKNPEKICNHFS